jgi:20S proteasome alpha/beta subunit
MKAVDGIILAADSRGTIGDPRGLTAINNSQIKIFPLGSSGLGIAGASEMAAVLLDEFRANGRVIPDIEQVQNEKKPFTLG